MENSPGEITAILVVSAAFLILLLGGLLAMEARVARRNGQTPLWRYALVGMRRLALVELAALTLLGGLYAAIFIPRDASLRTEATEIERLSGMLLPLEIGLRDNGSIPMWNPYIGTGEPILNNPFNYLFNPVSSLPVLLLGGIQGTKLALLLSLLVAGYSMWMLTRVIGVGTVARVTAGALYMMSGGIVGKLQAGHFQLGLSLVWIPLALAGFWWTLSSDDRRAPILTAVGFALLFFAGNIYYTLHTLIACALIYTLHILERHPVTQSWQFRFDRNRRAIIAGLFTLGLAMVQFLPVWIVRDFIVHPGDPVLESRYDLGQALVNLILPWDRWRVLELGPGELLPAVDYAYIGPGVFLLIASAIALPLAAPQIRRRFDNRAVWTALLLALVMMIWGAGQSSPVQYLYANIPFLAQFRFVGRALTIAALWWIVLAALALDMLWLAATDWLRSSQRFKIEDQHQLKRALVLGLLLWAAFALYSLQPEPVQFPLLPNNPQLHEWTETHRFTDFRTAAGGLWFFLAAGLVIDTGLLVALQLLLRIVRLRVTVSYRLTPWDSGARLVRMAVLLVAMTAIADLMQVNSRLIQFTTRSVDFRPLYARIRETEPDTPILSINKPDSHRFTYETYDSRTRNWGLDEGWEPGAPPGIVPPQALFEEPAWAVAIEESERSVRERVYITQQCRSGGAPQRPDAICDYVGNTDAGLYFEPEALPYAFVIAAGRLYAAEFPITASDVTPIHSVEHALDTVMIVAERPTLVPKADERPLMPLVLNGEDFDPTPYYLVIQETHFPGWAGFVDDQPVETISVGKFIGLPMPPGNHTYTVRYTPPGFAIGLIISLLTLVAMGFYLLSPVLISRHQRSNSERHSQSSR